MIAPYDAQAVLHMKKCCDEIRETLALCENDDRHFCKNPTIGMRSPGAQCV